MSRRGFGHPSSTRVRATDGDDDGYYESWAKYPDDQGVPPEIAQLLREAGDGEPDMWKTKPPWWPARPSHTGTAATAAPTAVFFTPSGSAPAAVPIVAWWHVFLVAVSNSSAEHVGGGEGVLSQERVGHSEWKN